MLQDEGNLMETVRKRHSADVDESGTHLTHCSQHADNERQIIGKMT